jgi:8-oxo-dGTP pyrophosphatase MutT (NUDIX family)
MHRKELLTLLDQHRTRFMDEIAYVRFAIDHIRQNENVFDRKMSVHVTGSAWVVSPDREHVLLMHHRKYNQWFQFGGHADGDPDVLRVALKETSEETGLDPSQIRLLDNAIFDVDHHVVPAIGTVPYHEHIDIRFVVEIDDSITIPGNNESHEVKWFPVHHVLRINNLRSTYRMLEKTRAMRNQLSQPLRRRA